MAANQHYWVVSVIQRFDTMELHGPLPLETRIKTDAEPHMYLPVFTSREAAIEWNGSDLHIYEMAGED